MSDRTLPEPRSTCARCTKPIYIHEVIVARYGRYVHLNCHGVSNEGTLGTLSSDLRARAAELIARAVVWGAQFEVRPWGRTDAPERPA
jgi:hypothetical protein